MEKLGVLCHLLFMEISLLSEHIAEWSVNSKNILTAIFSDQRAQELLPAAFYHYRSQRHLPLC